MIYAGDVRDVLKTLKAGSVQCVPTSPPYWGLRDYGVEGQIGLEPTLEAYVETMVEVFREVRRVLADDGVCFVNLGDTFASGEIGRHDHAQAAGLAPGSARAGRGRLGRGLGGRKQAKRPTGLKPKDLCLVPARVALALQADGWWVRSEIIWVKGVSFRPEWSGSVMPESVTDRPTRAHETVWLLTKSERYFYDAEAVRERDSGSPAGNRDGFKNRQGRAGWHARSGGVGSEAWKPGGGRNLRDVWAINPENFTGAHFATFPQALVAPMIKAGSSAAGVCPTCGKQWVRQVERGERVSAENYTGQATKAYGEARAQDPSETKRRVLESMRERKTTGWAPACKCETPPVRCTVLDPFLGSGTTGIVAKRLGREFVGIELSEEYAQMAREQIDGPLFAGV